MKFTQLMVLALVALFATAEVSLAQKANIKNVAVDYIIPPEKPLPVNVKSFYVEVTNNVLEFELMLQNEQKKIDLKGYERAHKKEDADFLVEYKVNSAKYEKKVLKATYKKKINDSTFVEKVGARYEIKAYLGTSVIVTDVANNNVISSVVGNVEDKTFQSKVYTTYNAAVYDINNMKIDDAKKLYKEIFDGQMKNLNENLNKDHGFPKKHLFMPIARGKGKKYDYSDLQNAFDKFSKVAAVYNKGQLTADEQNELKECIAIWEDAIKEYQPKTKKTRIGDKNIGSLYINAACAYFLTRDWAKVYEYVNKARNHKGQKVTSNILERITKDQERLYSLQPEGSLVAGM